MGRALIACVLIVGLLGGCAGGGGGGWSSSSSSSLPASRIGWSITFAVFSVICAAGAFVALTEADGEDAAGGAIAGSLGALLFGGIAYALWPSTATSDVKSSSPPPPAPTPLPSPDPRLPVVVPQAEIAQQMQLVEGTVRACLGTPTFAVDAFVQLAPQGMVTFVSVTTPDRQPVSVELANCVGAAVRGMRFSPAQQGATFTVPYR